MNFRLGRSREDRRATGVCSICTRGARTSIPQAVTNLRVLIGQPLHSAALRSTASPFTTYHTTDEPSRLRHHQVSDSLSSQSALVERTIQQFTSSTSIALPKPPTASCLCLDRCTLPTQSTTRRHPLHGSTFSVFPCPFELRLERLMNRILIIVAPVTLFAACGDPGYWAKPGATQTDFKMDQEQCKVQALSLSDPNGLFQAEIFDSCMQRKGWRIAHSRS